MFAFLQSYCCVVFVFGSLQCQVSSLFSRFFVKKIGALVSVELIYSILYSVPVSGYLCILLGIVIDKTAADDQFFLLYLIVTVEG